jgi:signal transduction histidine kinase/ActR/RegA family two-component response regulator
MRARLLHVLGGLRVRVAVLLLAGQLLAACGFYVLFTTLIGNWSRAELARDGRGIADRIAAHAVTPLILGDYNGLRDLLRREMRELDLVGASFLGPDGQALETRVIDGRLWRTTGAVVPRQLREPELSVHDVDGTEVYRVIQAVVRRGAAARDVHLDTEARLGIQPPRDQLVGWVRLDYSAARIVEDLATARQLGALLLLLAVAVGLLGSLALLRVVVRPLREAGALAREIADGNLARRLPVTSQDELGDLAESMNTMAAALARSLARERAESAALRGTAEAVMAIAQGARAARDPASVFRVVAAELRGVTRCDGVALAVPGAAEDALVFRHFDPPPPWGGLAEGAILDGPLAAALGGADPQSLRLETAQHPYPLTATLAARGVGAALLVPLALEGGPPAALLLVSSHPSAFGGSEVRVVTGLASHLAAALHAAQLRDRLENAFEELQRAKEQLMRSERLRVAGELASGIAHEFNNVLAAILGRVQLLRRRSGSGAIPPGELDQGLAILEVAAHDGAETVRRLRQFSLGAGDVAAPVDLDTVIREAVEFTRPRWKHEAASGRDTIDLRVQAQPGAWVRGSASELREVFTNLILNAVDALPRGGVIRVGAAPDGDRVRASVEDDGIGMSSETLRRAFEPFFTTKGVEGTGLGLSMVYGIVQRHGAALDVTSEPGRGTRIDLAFPRCADAPRPGEPPEAAPPADGAGLRVLVVDDEAAVRALLVDILTTLGVTVTGCERADEALRGFRPGRYQLVLTDLGMPGMNGWQLSQRLRAIDRNVMIVFVTGWGEGLDPVQVREAGADAAIGKPFTITDLEQVIREAGQRTGARAA